MSEETTPSDFWDFADRIGADIGQFQQIGVRANMSTVVHHATSTCTAIGPNPAYEHVPVLGNDSVGICHSCHDYTEPERKLLGERFQVARDVYRSCVVSGRLVDLLSSGDHSHEARARATTLIDALPQNWAQSTVLFDAPTSAPWVAACDLGISGAFVSRCVELLVEATNRWEEFTTEGHLTAWTAAVLGHEPADVDTTPMLAGLHWFLTPVRDVSLLGAHLQKVTTYDDMALVRGPKFVFDALVATRQRFVIDPIVANPDIPSDVLLGALTGLEAATGVGVTFEELLTSLG